MIVAPAMDVEYDLARRILAAMMTAFDADESLIQNLSEFAARAAKQAAVVFSKEGLCELEVTAADLSAKRRAFELAHRHMAEALKGSDSEVDRASDQPLREMRFQFGNVTVTLQADPPPPSLGDRS